MLPSPDKGLRAWMAQAPHSAALGIGMLAAFTAYFCMYAFRRPFAAAEFKGLYFLGSQLDLKTALAISQVFGYALSKLLGNKFCSEARPDRRAPMMIGLIAFAELALVLFGWLPSNWKVVAIFLNGIPLGMVWGLVVGFLEGRRASEILLAGLSSSFIVASGAVKDVGRSLLQDWNVSQSWMPALTGALFLPLFLLATWILNQIPPATAADRAERSERRPMNASLRWNFVRQFAPGLALLLVAYFFLTAYRDYRDTYGVEILSALGYGKENRAIFSRTELWVGLGVLIALAGLNLIQNNRWGLLAAFAVMAGGLALLSIATLLLDAGRIEGLTWMLLVGLGLYLAYVPYNSILFDRLVASTRVAGNAVFAIYLADTVGYSGSIGVQLYKAFGQSQISHLEFFRAFTYAFSLGGALLLLASAWYFARWQPTPRAEGLAEPAAHVSPPEASTASGGQTSPAPGGQTSPAPGGQPASR